MQLDAIQRRASILLAQYKVLDCTSLTYANDLESTDILTELVEIRSLLQNLRWYGFVNYDKILMKVAKFSNTRPTKAGLRELSRSNVDIQARCGGYLTVVIKRLIRSPIINESPHLPLLLPSLLQERYETNLREHVESAIHAIQADDTSLLEIALERKAGKQALHQDGSHLFGDMLFGCIILQSRSCLEYLLRYTHFISENSEHLARLIIKLGRISSSKLRIHKPVEDLMTAIDLPSATELLLYVIRRVRNHSRVGLFHEDPFGRLPLH